MNTGSTGLENFGENETYLFVVGYRLTSDVDNVVAAAKANGIRLIVALWVLPEPYSVLH